MDEPVYCLLKEAFFIIAVDGEGRPECTAVDPCKVPWLGLGLVPIPVGVRKSCFMKAPCLKGEAGTPVKRA